MQLKRIIVVLFSLAVFSGCVVVEDGTVGVSKSFGSIQDDALVPGPYWNIPVVREVEVWNIKTQRRNKRLNIPSSEGLIVGLEVAVLFRPTKVVRLRKKVGRDFVITVLDSSLIDTFREVIGKLKIESVITDQESLTAKVYDHLTKTMGDRGILVEELMITGLELPETFRAAIERKLSQEQKALQKTFELTQAQKDAEIEVARARGVAEAQEIVRETLSDRYLQYLWISTLNDNPNVIYVATEANMPLFRTASEPTKKLRKNRKDMASFGTSTQPNISK